MFIWQDYGYNIRGFTDDGNRLNGGDFKNTPFGGDSRQQALFHGKPGQFYLVFKAQFAQDILAVRDHRLYA